MNEKTNFLNIYLSHFSESLLIPLKFIIQLNILVCVCFQLYVKYEIKNIALTDLLLVSQLVSVPLPINYM